ncbi:amidohydrolase [Nocardia sp. CA-145437]|uniref:amidohydrolase n=1 Tax=Nocardia sp. CA-145437 TaxID=3239980 RepID=UPI003D95D90D
MRAHGPRKRRTLFIGGSIWSPGEPDCETLGIADGRVVAVGADALRWSRTVPAGDLRTVDLRGGFLMPAFGEGHAHPIFGGLEAVGPQVRTCTSVSEIAEVLRRWAGRHPGPSWIIGAGYDSSLAPDGLFDAAWLDNAVPDRPVMLRAWDYHTVWCNSAALELAGITADTPEPVLGEIPRRPDGSPLGTLREAGAVDLLLAAAPAGETAARVDALQRATARYARHGVTWVQDAWVEASDVAVYLEAARSGALSTRVNLALLADPHRFAEDLPTLLASRARVRTLDHPLLTANSIKFFADGIIENETAALLEPYCTHRHSRGMDTWEPAALADAAAAVDAAGFQLHIHAIGDAAVRSALDAVAACADRNGPRDRRPVIAHAQLISPGDIPRFAELGVVANVQPLWAQLDRVMVDLTMPRLGARRSERQYPFRSLAEGGARLAFGSDWPVSSAIPLDGIATAVTRRNAEGEPRGGWIPAELLDITTALDAYTAGVAHQAFADLRDAPWGTLAPGSAADLVWLDTDPRSSAPQSIPEIQVVETWLAGQTTYRRAAAGNRTTVECENDDDLP